MLWVDFLVDFSNENIAFILGGLPIGSAQSEHLVNYGILNYHTACLAPPNVTILRMYISEELLSDWALLGYARRPAPRGE